MKRISTFIFLAGALLLAVVLGAAVVHLGIGGQPVADAGVQPCFEMERPLPVSAAEAPHRLVGPGERIVVDESSPEGDSYSVMLDDAGRAYTITVDSAPGDEGLLSPVVELADAGGGLLFKAMGADGARRLTVLEVMAPEAGIYNIFLVTGGAGYSLVVERAEEETFDIPDTAATTAYAEGALPLPGVIGLPGDQDWYRVRLGGGELHTFHVEGVEGDGGTLPLPVLKLKNSLGLTVRDGWIDGDGGVTLTVKGVGEEMDEDFFISVSAVGASVGTYTLHHVPGDCSGRPRGLAGVRQGAASGASR